MAPWSSGQDASLSRWNQGFDSPWSHFLKGIRRRVLRIFFCLKAFVFKEFEALKIFLVLGGCMKL